MKRNKSSKKYRRRKLLEAYTFVLPYIIGTAAFFVFPIVFSFVISLGDFNITGEGLKFSYFGFAHYRNALQSDLYFTTEFYNVVINTLVNTPLIVIFSLIIAVFLNKNLAFKGFYRLLYFLPFVLGTGYVMQYLLGMGVSGEAMKVARSIMIPEEVQKYLSPGLVALMTGFFDRITVVLWKSGMQIILFLAGLQGISISLYESAKCDAATEWEMFWKITVPMISPLTFLIIVYTIIDSFYDPTSKMLSLFYEYAFVRTLFSYSSALSWIYAGFILVFIGIVSFIAKKMIYVENEV
ncbi:MAG: carbohydrate ABC transporter permease [Saccharofermentanales bacterium]